MDVRFYTFNKRENSIAAPSKTGGTLVSCQLLDNTSFQNPRLRLRRDDTIFTYNYFYIPIYDRFYFRSDIESDHTDLIISGTVDPLASFRDAILSSTQYVVRSASEYDGWLIDDKYPLSTETDLKIDALTDFGQSGCVIFGAHGQTGINYYKIDMSTMRAICAYMMDENNYTINGLMVDFFKYFFNPFQYIVDCFYIPYDITLEAETTIPIYFGSWNTGLNGKLFAPNSSPQPIMSQNLTLRNHPGFDSYALNGGQKGYWLRSKPYSKYYIVSSLFGTIDIDISEINISQFDSIPLGVEVRGDWMGNLELEIVLGNAGNDGNIKLIRRNASARIDLPLAQVSRNVMGALGTLATGAGAMVANPANAIGAGASAIGNAKEQIKPKVQSSGRSSGNTFYRRNWFLNSEFHLLPELDNEDMGRPLCKKKTLSSLSGFTVVDEPDVVMSGTPSERSKVHSFMKGGFYIE